MATANEQAQDLALAETRSSSDSPSSGGAQSGGAQSDSGLAGQSRQFRLAVDWLSAPDADATRSSAETTESGEESGECGEEADYLSVPSGVSYLIGPNGERPRVANSAGRNKRRAVLLEPLVDARPPAMVVIAGDLADVRVNGLRIPSWGMVHEKDQLQIGDYVLHVTLFNRTSIGPVHERHVGKECPVCRVHFESNTRVFSCPTCSGPLHLQGEETPEKDRLECALAVTDCPACQTRIEMTDGFSYEPELYRG
ncbi:MAG: hypothetical protein QGG36_09655 [Pirellulaceae bacterium]|jgi:hypothetical protein|nr:hypothetical protein [Pirellulaceae bacterium]MDP7016053.1 hypothetical protein [Pirellulaceae bacterium]